MSQAAAASDRLPLVEAREIKKHFAVPASLLAKLLAGRQDQVVRAVDGINLKIYAGETVGLVGESGCGKTTLGRVLARLYEPTAGQVLFRNAVVAGHPTAARHRDGTKSDQLIFDQSAAFSPPPNGLPPAGARSQRYYRLTQIIFQNPYSSLNPRKTVRDIVGVALRQRGVADARRREAETLRLLNRVGLSARHIDAYPHQFSAGQRQRIGIARALAMGPEFIVADEPVSALDVSIQAQVINLLEELQEEFNLTYLFIAHDLSMIHYLSDRVAVMYLGHIVEEAETAALFENPLHPYTQALLAAIPSVNRHARRERIILEGTVPSPIDPPAGCPFHTRCFAKKGSICEQEYPPEVEVGSHQVACWLYV